MSISVWLVLIEGCPVENETVRDVYKVFSSKDLAENCAKEINENIFNRKFDGMWVDTAWVSEYLVHEKDTL
jgi:hypothetical protein